MVTGSLYGFAASSGFLKGFSMFTGLWGLGLWDFRVLGCGVFLFWCVLGFKVFAFWGCFQLWNGVSGRLVVGSWDLELKAALNPKPKPAGSERVLANTLPVKSSVEIRVDSTALCKTSAYTCCLRCGKDPSGQDRETRQATASFGWIERLLAQGPHPAAFADFPDGYPPKP